MKVQDLYRTYKELKNAADKAEERMVEDFENEDLAEAFDEAYQKEFTAWMELVEEVEKLTGCTKDTAKAMVASEKFEKLMEMKVA